MKEKELLEDALENTEQAVIPEDWEKRIIRFKKPYRFEGYEYTEVDLSRLEDMTANDMIAVGKQYNQRNGENTATPEVTLEYAMLMAARAAKLPLEFFYGMPMKEATMVKRCVVSFLFGSD